MNATQEVDSLREENRILRWLVRQQSRKPRGVRWRRERRTDECE